MHQNTDMKIHLEYVAMLHLKGPASGSTMILDDGANVGALLDKLSIPGYHQTSVSVFINDTKVSHSRLIKDGDRVFLSIPMSGG